MKKKIHLLFIFFLSTMCLCAESNFNDSLAKITIKAKDYKNKCIFFYYSQTNNPFVTLDSTGYGEILVPIKETEFLNFGTSDSIFFNLLLEPGNDITYLIENSNIKILGKGSLQNNYLLNVKRILSNISKAIEKIDDTDVFIDFMNTSDIQLNQFHKNFTDSIKLPIHIAYILKKCIESKLLLEKQKFLFSIEGKYIDSLDLENKLNLINNEIFADSVLFKTGYTDFLSFLTYNFDRTIIRNKTFINCPNPNVYPILVFNEISKSHKYSEKIKEFLLFSNLSFDLSYFGINSTIENLIEVFHQLYPDAKFNAYLKRDLEKLKKLSKANIAPSFKGKTPTGKLVSLEDYKGKVLFIDVWATWCGPCKEELPFTHKIQEYYKFNNQVQILYISIDSEINRWQAFLIKNKKLNGNHININDSLFINSYKITGIPRYILIDKQGLIIDAFCSKPSSGEIEDKIRKALLNN
ncbi:MAG: TlpA family protein disulfide reductase [Bacteroidota bacterium]